MRSNPEYSPTLIYYPEGNYLEFVKEDIATITQNYVDTPYINILLSMNEWRRHKHLVGFQILNVRFNRRLSGKDSVGGLLEWLYYDKDNPRIHSEFDQCLPRHVFLAVMRLLDDSLPNEKQLLPTDLMEASK